MIEAQQVIVTVLRLTVPHARQTLVIVSSSSDMQWLQHPECVSQRRLYVYTVCWSYEQPPIFVLSPGDLNPLGPSFLHSTAESCILGVSDTRRRLDVYMIRVQIGLALVMSNIFFAV